jgi:hypothetical protein
MKGESGLMRRITLRMSVPAVAVVGMTSIVLAGCSPADSSPSGSDPSASASSQSLLPSWISPSALNKAASDKYNRIVLEDLVGMTVSEAKTQLGFPGRPPVGLSGPPTLVAITQGSVTDPAIAQRSDDRLVVTAAVAVSERPSIYLGVAPNDGVDPDFRTRGKRQLNQDALITDQKLDGLTYVQAVYSEKKR